jgi:hypothetical protein
MSGGTPASRLLPRPTPVRSRSSSGLGPTHGSTSQRPLVVGAVPGESDVPLRSRARPSRERSSSGDATQAADRRAPSPPCASTAAMNAGSRRSSEVLLLAASRVRRLGAPKPHPTSGAVGVGAAAASPRGQCLSRKWEAFRTRSRGTRAIGRPAPGPASVLRPGRAGGTAARIGDRLRSRRRRCLRRGRSRRCASRRRPAA